MEFITVSASPKCYEDVMEYIFSKLKNETDLYPSPEKVIKDLRLACEEVFVNIVSYAYSSGDGVVNVGCEIDGDNIQIILRDKGVPFNPFDAEDPDITSAIDSREIGGLGIFIVKRTMDDVRYIRDGEENVLVLKKRIIASKGIYN